VSRFKGVGLPTFSSDAKGDKIQIEVRKTDLELLKDLNTVYDELAPVDISSSNQTLISLPTSVSFTPFIEDTRITTGTTDRTERVNALAVGQTAILNWACGITGGSSRTITFALPSTPIGSTYQVYAWWDTAPTNTLSFQSSNISRPISTGGSVAAGSSIALNLNASGTSAIIHGVVKRLT
jgi:hypothetical protein